MRWIVRILCIAFVAAVFNLWLYWSSPEVAASHPNRYAIVKENTWQDFSGVAGMVYTGDPAPVPSGTFTNETLWAVTTNYCSGLSWVEAGWTRIGTDPIKYKFIYKVPYTNNCVYTEELNFGSPAWNSSHFNTLEYCLSGCSGLNWRWYLDGAVKRTLLTGWTYATYLEAGGEVGGHYTGIGMYGAVSSMSYRRGSTWSSFYYADSYHCDYGYNLMWNGGPNGILDWGYNPPGGCPA